MDSIGLCADTDTTFFGNLSTGFANPNYVWQTSLDGITWTDIPSSNSINLKISTPIITSNNSSKKYRLAAADGSKLGSLNCRIYSNIITLTTLNSLSLTITKDTTICKGSSVQLQVTGGSSYSWTPSQGLSNASVYNPVATPLSNTKFIVYGVDINGCEGKDSVMVTLITKPVFKFSSTNDTSVCAGSPVPLNGDNGSLAKYTWTPSQGLSNATIANPIAKPAATTTYTLKVSNKQCNYDSNFQVVITINPTPALRIPHDTILCQSISLHLPATGNATSYSWTPAQYLNNANIVDPVITVSTSTKFYVSANNAFNCPVKDSVNVKFIPKPLFVFSSLKDTSVCAGNPVPLNGNNGNSYTYSWSPSQGLDNASDPNPIAKPSTTTSYTLLVSENTCHFDSSVTVNIAVHPYPSLAKTPDTTVCQGAPFNLWASSDATSYSWSPSQYLDNAAIGNPVATPVKSTRFYVKVNTVYNCPVSDSVLVSFIAKPVFENPADASICVGSSLQLKGDNGNSYSYAWSPADYLDNASGANPLASPVATIQYNLNITQAYCGYDTNFKVNLVVNPLPVISVQKTNDINCSIPTARLSATGASDYTWSPATGLDDAHSNSPLISIDTTTLFSVTGTDQYGCIGNSSVKVAVTLTGKGNYELPNAFTPNNDGHNDCFGISHWGSFTLQEFNVYNRWGQNIFSTKNPMECWDGTLKGKPQDPGGYPYVVLAKTLCGVIKRTGIVMLVR